MNQMNKYRSMREQKKIGPNYRNIHNKLMIENILIIILFLELGYIYVK